MNANLEVKAYAQEDTPEALALAQYDMRREDLAYLTTDGLDAAAGLAPGRLPPAVLTDPNRKGNLTIARR